MCVSKLKLLKLCPGGRSTRSLNEPKNEITIELVLI